MKQKWFNTDRIGGIRNGVFAIAMTRRHKFALIVTILALFLMGGWAHRQTEVLLVCSLAIGATIGWSIRAG